MASGKSQRMYSQDQVNEIIRKRLARAKQPVSAYTVTTLPGFSEARAKKEPDLTPEQEEELDKAEVRAWWRKEAAEMIADGLPDHPNWKWEKLITEVINEAMQEAQELRASGEERRADDIDVTVGQLQDIYDRGEAVRDAAFSAVYPEVRATREQEQEAIAKFSFLPEAEKEAIKARVMREYIHKLRPEEQILRKCFERKLI